MDPGDNSVQPGFVEGFTFGEIRIDNLGRPVRPQECAVCEEKAFLYGEAYRVMLVSSHFTSIMRELMRCSVTQIN